MTSTTRPLPPTCLSVPGVTMAFPTPEGPAMTTTTSHFRPDVPLPAGATAEDDACAIWETRAESSAVPIVLF
jgi:hypothetical protein